MAILAPSDLLVLVNHFKGLQTLRRPEPTHDQEPRRRPRRRAHRQDAAVPGAASFGKHGGAGRRRLGVLFLDELPEFHPQVLDALRQPLETGETVIVRANHRIAYPSRIQLIAAMNPSRCGRAGEPGYVCRQGRACAERYQARISGPMLDRIDLQIEVPAVSAADLVLPQASEGNRRSPHPDRSLSSARSAAPPHQCRMRRGHARGDRSTGARRAYSSA